MSQSKVAFISGHTDLPQSDFDTHYIPQIQQALNTTNTTFIFGDASGVDTQSLTYLLSPTIQSLHPTIQSRITIYCSSSNNISKYARQGVNVISPRDPILTPTPHIKSLIGIKDTGRNRARYRHMARDAYMTLHSDYDILWVRNESEAREFYGGKWRERLSATEMNMQRRENLRAVAEGREVPFVGGKRVGAGREGYVASSREENEDLFGELPGV